MFYSNKTGPERLQMLNDSELFNKWRCAFIEISKNILAHGTTGRSLYALDVGDGSALSLMLATVAQQFSLDVSIITMERKQFSNIFFSQLVDANKYSDKILFIDELSEVDDMLCGEEESNPELPSKISILFCECFFYQLSSQPVWQALSYLYMRNTLQPLISSQTCIMPLRARVMCAALELPDLCRNHGFVHRYLL